MESFCLKITVWTNEATPLNFGIADWENHWVLLLRCSRPSRPLSDHQGRSAVHRAKGGFHLP